MSVSFKVFRGQLISWKELFDQAADFATSLGPSRVLCISHSDAGCDGVVTVWYRDAEGSGEEGRKDEPGSAPVLGYELFRAAWISWGELFQQAADFASRIGTERLLGISHSCEQRDGVVTLWYWK